MSSSGMSVGGLVSGLDTNAIIDGLVSIEKQSVKRLENKKENVNLSISAWGTLQSNLSSLQTKSKEINDPDQFDKYTLTSSNEDILTIEGKDGGQPGSFAIQVFQTAKSEKIVSKTYASAATGIGLSGSFTVNLSSDYKKLHPTEAPATITVAAGDALKDIVNKINGTANIGVSASILKLADNEYTMVLTSKDTGATGATYTEVSGTVLRDLGVLNAAGEKGNVTHKVQSQALTAGGSAVTAASFFSAIDGAGSAINDTITIKGTDHNGNEIKGRNFVISDPATTSITEFLKDIEAAFNGTVTASVENGRIMVTDKTTGRSSLKVELTANNEGGGALALNGLLSVNTAGKSGTLQVGQDAFFNVDGLAMHSAKNDADDAIQGVVVKIKKADLTESVTTSISRDNEGIKANVQGFLDAFNLTIKTIKEQTAVKVTEKDKDSSNQDSASASIEKAPLAGDSTVSRLKNELITILTRQHEELKGSTYTSLASVGIISNQYTGEYEIDSDKFTKALDTDYEAVKKLFVLTGEGKDTSFIYGTSSTYTSPGRYQIDVDAKTVSMLDTNDNITATYNAEISGNVLVVKEEGKAKGLSITVPDTGSTLFTFSKGLGLEISDFVKKVTDTYDGYITQRTKNLENEIKQYDLKIADENDRVARYEEQLKTTYASLEQAMSKIKNQGASLVSQLGSF